MLSRILGCFAALIVAAAIGLMAHAPVATAAYDAPIRVTYGYSALDWHSGAITRYLLGPKGKRGRVVDVAISPTTSFVGTSTPANVQVGYGTGAQLYAYANVPCGTAASPTQVGSPIVASANPTANGLVALMAADFPLTAPTLLAAADTPVIVTFNPGTGGGVAGVADVYITIEWI